MCFRKFLGISNDGSGTSAGVVERVEEEHRLIVSNTPILLCFSDNGQPPTAFMINKVVVNSEHKVVGIIRSPGEWTGWNNGYRYTVQNITGESLNFYEKDLDICPSDRADVYMAEIEKLSKA